MRLNPSERFRTSVEMVTGLRRALGIGPRTQAIGTAFEQESIEAPASAYASHDHSLVDTSTIRTTARVDDQLVPARLPLDEVPQREASSIAHRGGLAVFISSVVIGVLAVILTLHLTREASFLVRFGLIPPVVAAVLAAGFLTHKQLHIRRVRPRTSPSESSTASQNARGTLNLDDFAHELAHESRLQVPLALLYRTSGPPLELFDGSYLIAGSDPDCAIHLNTPQASWRHVLISAKQGGVAMQRMPGARTPVFVNQREIDQAKLSDNDELGVADIKLRVRVPWPHWQLTIQSQLRADLSVNSDTLDPIPSKFREAAIVRFLGENKDFGIERTSACGIRLLNRASIESLRRTAELLDSPSTALQNVPVFQDALSLVASAVGMELGLV